MSLAEKFNTSTFSRWINHRPGRVFRLGAGCLFVVMGVIGLSNHRPWGIAALVWSVFPLSAGLLDICYISAALGGPLQGRVIRMFQDKAGR